MTHITRTSLAPFVLTLYEISAKKTVLVFDGHVGRLDSIALARNRGSTWIDAKNRYREDVRSRSDDRRRVVNDRVRRGKKVKRFQIKPTKRYECISFVRGRVSGTFQKRILPKTNLNKRKRP